MARDNIEPPYDPDTIEHFDGEFGDEVRKPELDITSIETLDRGHFTLAYEEYCKQRGELFKDPGNPFNSEREAIMDYPKCKCGRKLEEVMGELIHYGSCRSEDRKPEGKPLEEILSLNGDFDSYPYMPWNNPKKNYRPEDNHMESGSDHVCFTREPKTEFEGGFVKDLKGKLQLDLTPPEIEEIFTSVLEAGLKKGYPRDSWTKKGATEEMFLSAARRHINKRRKGEKIDPETGCSHLAHAGWQLMAAAYHELKGNFDE